MVAQCFIESKFREGSYPPRRLDSWRGVDNQVSGYATIRPSDSLSSGIVGGCDRLGIPAASVGGKPGPSRAASRKFSTSIRSLPDESYSEYKSDCSSRETAKLKTGNFPMAANSVDVAGRKAKKLDEIIGAGGR